MLTGLPSLDYEVEEERQRSQERIIGNAKASTPRPGPSRTYERWPSMCSLTVRTQKDPKPARGEKEDDHRTRGLAIFTIGVVDWFKEAYESDPVLKETQ